MSEFLKARRTYSMYQSSKNKAVNDLKESKMKDASKEYTTDDNCFQCFCFRKKKV